MVSLSDGHIAIVSFPHHAGLGCVYPGQLSRLEPPEQGAARGPLKAVTVSLSPPIAASNKCPSQAYLTISS